MAVYWQLPPNAECRFRKAEELRAKASQYNTDSASEIREGVRALHDDGLSNREIGVVIGVSFQRVHQLLVGSGSSRPTPVGQKVRRAR